MGSIIKKTMKDKSVRYLAQARVGGIVIGKTFQTRPEAVKWIRESERMPAPVRSPQPVFQSSEPLNTEIHSVTSVIDRYIREVLPQKRSTRAPRQQLEWWRMSIGHMPVNALSPASLAHCKAELSAQKRKGICRSPSTINRYMAALSTVLTCCVKDWFILDANPMLRLRRCKEPRGRTRILDEKERGRLINAVVRGPESLLVIVLLALQTGMRAGEIMGMDWSRVDTRTGRVMLPMTKNGSPRAVVVVGDALIALQEWKKRNGKTKGLVFPSETDGARPLDFRSAWRTARARAGLRDLHFHDLRHCTASYLAMSGASLPEIAEVLGHKTLQMVQRYAHFAEGSTRSILETMVQKFPAKKDEKKLKRPVGGEEEGGATP